MRIIIENADDRDHVDANWSVIRAALPMRLEVVDGRLVATFRPLQTASDQTLERSSPHPAADPPAAEAHPAPQRTPPE